MGTLVQKASGRRTGVVERLVKMYFKAVQVFMDYADVGFRYIDIPQDNDLGRPRKKVTETKTTSCWSIGLKPSFQH